MREGRVTLINAYGFEQSVEEELVIEQASVSLDFMDGVFLVGEIGLGAEDDVEGGGIFHEL